jgi:hypothetical protein
MDRLSFSLSPHGGEGRVRGKFAVHEATAHPGPLPSPGEGVLAVQA